MSSHSPKLKQTPPGLSDRASDIILVVLCLAILLVVAYPLYYVLVASFPTRMTFTPEKRFFCPVNSRSKDMPPYFPTTAF